MSDSISEASGENARPAEVFLSYHSPDRPDLLKIRELLAARGIATFLDRDNLVAGMPWPQALEQALGRADAVAVFLGGHGFGLWQKREMGYALDKQVREEQAGRSFPVIPVLLQGSDPTAGFLFLNTWIDLRRDVADPEAIEGLARAIRGGAPGQAPEPASAICPYRGLRPFSEEDRAFFFGRDAYIERVLEATLRQPLVVVVGPSGSGKSSLVHAGLFPRLRSLRPPDSTWDMVSFVPTDRPFHQLSAALIGLLLPDSTETERLAEGKKLGDQLATGEVTLEAVIVRALQKSGGTDRLLLVVDQFEDLFNKTPDADRNSLVSMLLTAVKRAPLTLLLTLRASFYTHTMQTGRELSDYLERGLVNLGPPTNEELRSATLEPARRCALTFEAGLVERILGDLADAPGQLALLEFALTRLWDKRRGRVLTHAAYEEIGTVTGAIAKRAEETYQGLTEQHRIHARHVFTRLWTPGGPEGTQETRQRVIVAELGPTYWPVIKALTDARLAVTGRDPATGEDTVEVAHDALRHEWDRLEGWLAEDRQFLSWRARLREGVAEWAGARDAALLRGRLLDEAHGWRERRPGDLTAREIEFIQQSELYRGRELATQARQRGRLALAMSVLAAAALALAAFSFWQQIELVRQGRELDSQRRASLAMERLQDEPDQGLREALKAFEAKDTEEAKQAVRRALLESRVRMVLGGEAGHTNVVSAMDVTADGRVLATGSIDGSVRLWDLAQGRMKGGKLELGRPVLSVRLTPDGKRVFAVGDDGLARVWAVDGGKALEPRGPPGPAHAAIVSPDASVVVVIGADRQARLWRAESGEALGLPIAHDKGVTAIAVSDDGSLVATGGGDGSIRLWKAADGSSLDCARAGAAGVSALAFAGHGRLLAAGDVDGAIRLLATRATPSPKEECSLQVLQEREGHKASVTAVLFNPDGTKVASAGQDNDAALWDVSDGASLKPLHRLAGHTDAIEHLAFKYDGRLLATASNDWTAIVWDVETGSAISSLRGHTDALSGVLFNPDRSSDETRVITISRDHSARQWAAVTGQDWTVIRGYAGAVSTVYFSPDGGRILTAGAGSSARISFSSDLRTEHELSGHRDSLNVARFSPDGSRAVTGSRGMTARVWNVATGKEMRRLEGHTDAIRDARFSPDGTRIVTASNDRTVRVWDAGTGKTLRELDYHKDRVYTAVFSPDGRLVATGSADHTAMIWDPESGRLHVLERHPDGVRSVAFSPDGQRLVTASADGTVRVWRVGSGELVGALKGHTRRVETIEFSRDGRRIITASWDGTARIWNAETLALQEPVLAGHRSSLTAAVFSPDGQLAATAGRDSNAYLWDVKTGKVVRELIGHTSDVLDVAFSPDGKRVATASRDGTVRLWSASAGAPGVFPACDACAPVGELVALARKRVAAFPSQERQPPAAK